MSKLPFAVFMRCAVSFVLVLTLSLAATRLRAQVLVSAPTADQARLLGSWYQSHIPLCFRVVHGSLNIRELTDLQMDQYLRSDCGQEGHVSENDDDTGDIDGVYEGDPDRISLRLYPNGQPDLLTFAHEYGHYVWFKLLSAADRHAYAAVYRRQRSERHLVTDYARTNVEEGFAEAFSFYSAAPRILAARDPGSFRFLAELSSMTRGQGNG